MGYFDDDPRVPHGRVGRGPGRGSNHRNALLTEDQAREIKRTARLPRGERPSGPQLADIYGVSSRVINDIRAGRSWSHVHIEEDA